MAKEQKTLTEAQIRAINEAISANLRVEIASTADGVKIYKVKRTELNY